MKQAVTTLAFLSAVVGFLVVGGGGAALLIIPNSGELGTGALLAFCAAVALACVMALIFAPLRYFREPTWRAGAIAAAIIGAMPAAGIAAAAFRFAGLPVSSAVPTIDWSVFFAGLVFALGALSILALGYLRSQTPVATIGGKQPETEASVVHMQQLRSAQAHLRKALEKASAAVENQDDGVTQVEDDIRVRRV